MTKEETTEEEKDVRPADNQDENTIQRQRDFLDYVLKNILNKMTL